MDPSFSGHYIGRYTKRAVLAEYRITHYHGKIVRFAYKDYAQGGATSYTTIGVLTFIGRLVRHIPDKHFPMIRHAGIFANRWKHRCLPMARRALKQAARGSSPRKSGNPGAERQTEYRGRDPLTCPDCNLRMILLGSFFGAWTQIHVIFLRAGKNPSIPTPLRPSFHYSTIPEADHHTPSCLRDEVYVALQSFRDLTLDHRPSIELNKRRG